MEFSCWVDLVPLNQVDDRSGRSKPGAGRPKRRGFPLDKSHPLHHTHRAVIRTKLPVPIFEVPHRPAFPKDLPATTSSVERAKWEKQLEHFADHVFVTYVSCSQVKITTKGGDRKVG